MDPSRARIPGWGLFRPNPLQGKDSRPDKKPGSGVLLLMLSPGTSLAILDSEYEHRHQAGKRQEAGILMSMNRVTGGSPFVQPNLLDKFQVDKKDKDGAEQAGAQSGANTSATPVADRAEISDTAQKLVDLRAAVDTGRAALDSLPEVREEKVAEVRQRMQDGFYQSAEVQEELSGILQGVLNKMDEL